jgi:hypothetical protein
MLIAVSVYVFTTRYNPNMNNSCKCKGVVASSIMSNLHWVKACLRLRGLKGTGGQSFRDVRSH